MIEEENTTFCVPTSSLLQFLAKIHKQLSNKSKLYLPGCSHFFIILLPSGWCARCSYCKVKSCLTPAIPSTQVSWIAAEYSERATKWCLDNLHVLSGNSCPFKTPPERAHVVLVSKHKDSAYCFFKYFSCSLM